MYCYQAQFYFKLILNEKTNKRCKHKIRTIFNVAHTLTHTQNMHALLMIDLIDILKSAHFMFDKNNSFFSYTINLNCIQFYQFIIMNTS